MEAEATRELLLDAAEEAFLEYGFSGTSLETIARRAGHSRGAIYWHFRDKSDLFVAMLSRVQLPLSGLVESFHQDTGGDPVETLRRLCRFALEKLIADPRHRRVHTILLYRCERIGEVNPTIQRQDEISQEFLRLVEQLFQRAAEEGRLNPKLTPAVAASALHAYMWGLLSQYLRSRAKCNLDEHADALLDAFFDWVARSAPGTPA